MKAIPDPREVLQYNADTGVFIWRATLSMRAVAGNVAGCAHPSGYWVIKINRKMHYAHRLAWFFVHGEWPVNDIDHINLNRGDNRIANLRPATRSQNMQNKAQPRASKAPFKGVRRSRDKWSARIGVNGAVHHLGQFATPEEAHAAYVRAAAKMHGEFARRA